MIRLERGDSGERATLLREAVVNVLAGDVSNISRWFGEYVGAIYSRLKLIGDEVELESYTDAKDRESLPTEARADWIVAGGGISGILAALDLAKQYPNRKIILVEKEKEIFPKTSSSAIQPGRAGFGFHYFHLPTALRYLTATVAFFLRFIEDNPEIIQDYIESPNHPRRRGHYGLKKGGTYKDPKEVLATYEALREKYTELCLEYPILERRFGLPENFYKKLTPEEANEKFKGFAYFDPEVYECVVETAEVLLDVDRFLALIKSQVKEQTNIEVHYNCELVCVSDNRTDDEKRDRPYEGSYTCHTLSGKKGEKNTEDDRSVKSFYAPQVVIATWAHAPYHAQTAGASLWNEAVVNRLKAKIVVTLPEELAAHPSLFIGMGGPGCMITNLGKKGDKRIAHITASEVTNVIRHEIKNGAKVPSYYTDYLDGNIPECMKRHLAESILNEAQAIFRGGLQARIAAIEEQGSSQETDLSEEIVKLRKQCELLKEITLIDGNDYIGFGTVQIDSDDKFKGHNSELHRRTRLGVGDFYNRENPERSLPGLYMVCSRKFFFCVSASELLMQKVMVQTALQQSTSQTHHRLFPFYFWRKPSVNVSLLGQPEESFDSVNAHP